MEASPIPSPVIEIEKDRVDQIEHDIGRLREEARNLRHSMKKLHATLKEVLQIVKKIDISTEAKQVTTSLTNPSST